MSTRSNAICKTLHNSIVFVPVIKFVFFPLNSGGRKQWESPCRWRNVTFCLNPLPGLFETANESLLFSGGSVLEKVSVMKLLFFILTLLEPPSPFEINIQKLLIKNPPPHPPLEQDKQIWGCVCSLLAHPILYFNDFTSTSEKKKKNARWHDAAECDIKRWRQDIAGGEWGEKWRWQEGLSVSQRRS